MIKKLLFLFFLSILTACSVNGGISKYETPNFKEAGVLLLPAEDRALFVATGVLFTLVDSNGVKTVLRVNDWEEPINPSEGHGKKYFGAFSLPEGNYKLTAWRLIYTEGKPAKEPSEPLTFSINKGEVIYIGNFNAIRPIGNGQFRDKYSEDSKKFRSLYSWLTDRNIKKELVKSSWWPLPDGIDPKDLTKNSK